MSALGRARQCDRRDTGIGAGPDRWLCSFQNNGRKGGGGEAQRNWAWDPGGRVEGPGSWRWLQSLPLWHNLLPQPASGAGRATPSQAQAKDVSSARHPGPSISSSQERRPQGRETGRGEAGATASLPATCKYQLEASTQPSKRKRGPLMTPSQWFALVRSPSSLLENRIGTN